MDTITTTSAINYNAQYCYHRLPCGYCQILQRACPMYSSPTITNTIPVKNAWSCTTKNEQSCATPTNSENGGEKTGE